MVDRVRLYAGPHCPALHLTDEQVFRPAERLDWMLRIVDVARALEARGWPAGVSGSLRLQVRDAVLAENDSCYLLELADGACRVSRAAQADGAVAIHVRGLAALFAGRCSPAELRQAGLLGGVSDQDGLLQSAFSGPPPWMPDYF